MKSMVVLFALVAAACGSLVPLAQPPHHPALVLDPHGRPLDTAEVINARALHLQAKALDGHYAPLAHAAVVAPIAHSVAVAPVVVAAPAAVSHQSRVDVRTSHPIATSVFSLPYAAHPHYLHKRSLGHYAYAAPVIAPSAVSHQSRVDVISSPAIVSHAIAAPVVAHAAPVVAQATPVVAVAPAAVSHQSRVDVRTSHPVVSHSVVAPIAHAAPVYSAPAVYAAAPIAYGAHAGLALSHGHYLKKRSLAHLAIAPVVHSVPAAVSHQSRVDVISKPAVVTTSVLTHAAPAYVATPAVYAAPVVSHVAPLTHSSIWTAPLLRAAHW